MGVPADAELVGRVLAGEVEAYAVLVARYAERYGRYARRMLGDPQEAEEALQDAFVRAYRALGRCQDPERFGSWLFRILVNRCRTSGRRSTRRRNTIVHDDRLTAAASVPPDADRSVLREQIEWALAKLEAGQREAFILKYVEDLSYEEMQEMTGVGLSALKMRVKRACERLRVSLRAAERV